jgi:hypothetical protein
MLPLPIRIALAIHLALIAASAIAGPVYFVLIDPLSPLAETAQLGVLLGAAIVFHEVSETTGPRVKRAGRALLRRWKRWRNRR